MVIKEIHIDSFGLFNHVSLTDLKKGLHVIIGDNETGKSTLLAFLRYTLFGYPDLRSKMNPYLPPDTSKRSGRIKAILSSGEEVVFERTEGSKGGKINLTMKDDASQSIRLWHEQLGNATADLYNNVYTFSLDELVSLESLSASGIEDKIFSIGLGLGRLSLSDIENNIQDRLNQVYHPRSGKTEINSILTKIDEKRARIQDIKGNLPAYKQLVSAIKQTEKGIATVQEKVADLKGKCEHFKTYSSCYESYTIYLRAAEELKKLPDPQDYPANGPEQLNRLEEKAAELDKKIEDLQTGTPAEEGLNTLEHKIKSISYNKELIKKSEVVEYLRRNIEKYKQTTTDKNRDNTRLERLNQSIKQAVKKINARWNEQHIIQFTDLVQHKDTMGKFQSHFDELRERKREIDVRRRMTVNKIKHININTVVIAISLFFMILAIPAFMGFYYAWGSASLLVALLLFAFRKYFMMENIPGTIQEQFHAIAEQEAQLTQQYENYLVQHLNLPGSLSPASVLEIFRQIEHLKEEINNRDRLQEQQQQRVPFILKFEKEVNAFTGNMQPGTLDGPVEVQANQIITAFDQQVRLSQEKSRLQAFFNQKKRERDSTKRKRKAILDEITQLFKLIHAADTNDFRRKYEKNQRIKELLAEQKKAEQTIETIAGMGRTGEIIEFLNSTSKEKINAAILELNDQIEQKSAELEALNRELGEKRNERQRLEGASELSVAMTELEIEKNRLNLVYRDWLAGKAALRILSDVKADYEKARQPRVIQNANTYFNAITDGRYPVMQVSLNEKEVTVYDKKGVAKRIAQLSRGTKEQLLISLRLGFIEEYETNSEALPIIIDEVLVNFDPQRAQRCAKIFEDFAQERQVLLFTCHPDIKTLFKKAQIHTTIGTQRMR